MIIAGGSAYSRAMARLRPLPRRWPIPSAPLLLVDMAHFSGLVAAGLHPNPCDYADIVTSTTHKTLRGPRAGIILAKEQYGAAIDKSLFPGVQGGPLVHVIAAKAVCFLEAHDSRIQSLTQKQVVTNAQALAAGAAGRRFPHRLRRHRHTPHACRRFLERRQGQRSRDSLGTAARITVNKNAIPFDTNPPLNPSGIRLGSPAVTTRGFGEAEMREVASCIAEVLNDIDSEAAIAAVRDACEALPHASRSTPEACRNRADRP